MMDFKFSLYLLLTVILINRVAGLIGNNPKYEPAYLEREVWLDDIVDRGTIQDAYIGSTSSDIYYHIWSVVGTPGIAAYQLFFRQRADGTVAWARRNTGGLYFNGFILNPSETWVYYTRSGQSIFRMRTSDGVIDTALYTPDTVARSAFPNHQVIFDSSNQEYLVLGGYDTGSNQGKIGIVSMETRSVSGIRIQEIFQYTNKLVALSTNDVFVSGVNSGSPTEQYLMVVRLDGSTKWAHKNDCPEATGTSGYNEAITDQNKEILYTFTSFGPNSDTVGFKFEISTGTLLSNKVHYTSGSSNWKAILHDQSIILITNGFSKRTILKLNEVDLSIQDFAQTSESDVRTLLMHPTDQSVIVAGTYIHETSPHTVSSPYIAKAKFDKLQFLPTFRNVDIIESVEYEDSDPNYKLLPHTPSLITVSHSNLVDKLLSTSYETESTFVYNTSLALSTLISYNLDTEEFNVTSGMSGILPVGLSGAADGVSSTSFSLNNYDTFTLPSWVSLDEQNELIVFDAPSTADTFKFSIDTTVTGWTEPRPKVIQLNVMFGSVEFGDSCSPTNHTEGKKCNEGYRLTDSDSCQEDIVDGDIKISALYGQMMALASVIFCLSSSILNSSSPAAVWVIVNHFQMLMLLLLTGAHVPMDVVKYLTASYFVMTPFNFLKISITFGEFEVDDFQQNIRNLEEMGLESSSTFFNSQGLIQTLLFLACIHLVSYILTFLNLGHSSSRWVRVTKYVITHVYSILTFTIYVRVILEGFLFLVISATFEIYSFQVSSKGHIFSLIFAIGTFLVAMGIIFGVYLHLRRVREVKSVTKMMKLRELYAGLKGNPMKRAYIGFWLLRRLIFVIVVAFLQFLPSVPVSGLLLSFQLLYLIYLGYQLPFLETKVNIIDILNELFFFILIIGQLYYDSKERWNSDAIDYVVWILTANNFIVLLITFGAFILDFSKRFGKRNNSTQEIAPKTRNNRDVTNGQGGHTQQTPDMRFERSRISEAPLDKNNNHEESKFQY